MPVSNTPDSESNPIQNLINQTFKLLSIDPFSFGGLVVRGRYSPAREKLLKLTGVIHTSFHQTKLYPKATDDELLGGLDFSLTLEKGKPVYRQGLLKKYPSMITLAMAERINTGLATKYGTALDNNEAICIIALDEGAEDDETLPRSLLDRLAFYIPLEGTRSPLIEKPDLDMSKINVAKKTLKGIHVNDDITSQIVTLAHHLGIDSLRGPIFALRAAKALAAYRGSNKVEDCDVLEAVKVTLPHRATIIPDLSSEEPMEEDQEVSEKESSEDQQNNNNSDPNFLKENTPQELLLEAIKSSLPKDALRFLLIKNNLKISKTTNQNGVGQKKLSNRKGRPLPSRQGKLDSDKRLDILATLRAATPWQKIRKNFDENRLKITDQNIIFPKKRKIYFQLSDIRIRRNEDQSDRLIIFLVDASGSSAVGRLAEAKGAIEILLSEAYAKRDQVALIAFRNKSADTLLNPTRSLVQAKKRLAALPGGGATPLASGLRDAYNLSQISKSKGLSPVLAVLTDGRANISLNGDVSRTDAMKDSKEFAEIIKASNISSLVIDTSNQPQKSSKDIAEAMGANYLPLPRADAKKLSIALNRILN